MLVRPLPGRQHAADVGGVDRRVQLRARVRRLRGYLGAGVSQARRFRARVLLRVFPGRRAGCAVRACSEQHLHWSLSLRAFLFSTSMLVARLAVSHSIITSEPHTHASSMVPLAAYRSVSKPWTSAWIGLPVLVAATSVITALVVQITVIRPKLLNSPAGTLGKQQARELLGMDTGRDGWLTQCCLDCVRARPAESVGFDDEDHVRPPWQRAPADLPATAPGAKNPATHLSRKSPILGPSWAILGLSWGRLGPSWGYLGPSWGRLGAILALRWV